MIGFFFFTTQYLQGVLGFSPLQAGLGFLPMTVVNFAVAILIPRVIRRFGSVVPLVAGVALTLAGMIWLSRITPGSDYLLAVALPMIIIGAGQGLVFAPLTSAAMAGVDEKDAGAASGLVNTFHQLGSSLGIGILVVAAAAATGATPAAQLSNEVSAALTAGSVLLGLCLVAVLALIVPRSADSIKEKS
jgi:Na+/melibiose symporter-like transporter